MCDVMMWIHTEIKKDKILEEVLNYEVNGRATATHKNKNWGETDK